MQPLLQKAGVQADTADLTTQEMPQNSGPKQIHNKMLDVVSINCIGIHQLFVGAIDQCLWILRNKRIYPPGSLNTGESKRFAFRSCQRSVKEELADAQKHLKETKDGVGE